MTAGRGQSLTLTNATNGNSSTLPSSGVVDIVTTRPDKSTHNVALGAHVIILFPTDVPVGAVDHALHGQGRLHGRRERGVDDPVQRWADEGHVRRAPLTAYDP